MKLEPCPFCGSPDSRDRRDENGWIVIQCDDCGAIGPCIEDDLTKAMENWNRRVTQQKRET